MSTAAIIMAAGQSTRMNSDLPKVLHDLCGRPMLSYVLDACRAAGVGPIYVVIGHRADLVRSAFKHEHNVHWVEQTERKGTGHAVLCCETAMAELEGSVIVIAGDMPLVRSTTIEALISEHQRARDPLTLATAILPDPTGYGRIVRDAQGQMQRIVEQRDCTPEQLAITEVNPSYYCFDKRAMFAALHEIKPNPLKGEYYLTDTLQILISKGQRVGAIPAVSAEEATGINSREELALVGRIMQERIQREWMAAGVTLVDPGSTWIQRGASIGRDTVVYPFTFIDEGACVGRSCRVGPFACLMAGDQVGDGEAVGGFADSGNSARKAAMAAAVQR